LVQFDLSSIPACSTITSATLTLTFDQNNGSGTTRTYGAHRVTRAWSETTSTWNVASTGNNWTTAGGDFVAGATATTSVSSGPSGMSFSWNVLTDVTAFVYGTQTNSGWVVKDETESSGNQSFTFGSKDNATASFRPTLTINYTAVSCDDGNPCTTD